MARARAVGAATCHECDRQPVRHTVARRRRPSCTRERQGREGWVWNFSLFVSYRIVSVHCGPTPTSQ
eukprot:1369056-Prymnesium_polylepis.1